MSKLWKKELRITYMKAWRQTGDKDPDSGDVDDDDDDVDSNNEGDQFFVAYSPPPEPESGMPTP